MIDLKTLASELHTYANSDDDAQIVNYLMLDRIILNLINHQNTTASDVYEHVVYEHGPTKSWLDVNQGDMSHMISLFGSKDSLEDQIEWFKRCANDRFDEDLATTKAFDEYEDKREMEMLLS